MSDRDLYSGLIRLHILYHAEREEIFGLGIIEGLTKYFYPEASNTVIFVVMVIVLLVRPAGLFGKER